jgi:hypothetical protein
VILLTAVRITFYHTESRIKEPIFESPMTEWNRPIKFTGFAHRHNVYGAYLASAERLRASSVRLLTTLGRLLLPRLEPQ